MITYAAFTPTERTGPGPFSANDIADFEEYIASQLQGRKGAEAKDVECYLRRFPGRNIRDWKGEGDPDYLPDARPHEEPWHRLNQREVRAEATQCIARSLPANVRQAAARDPELVWNPLARRYRFRQPDDPPHGGNESLLIARSPTGGG